MNSRALLIAAFLVGILLPGALIASPGVYYVPLESHSYGIATDSTDAFHSTVAEADLDRENATAVSDLSPATQRAFDEPRSELTDGESGWQAVTVTVCHDSLLVCPAYDEAPDFPHDGMTDPGARTGNSYGLVEADDEQYVVETRDVTSLGFGFFVVHPIALSSFMLYAFYLGLTAMHYHDSQPARVVGCTAYGVLLLCWPLVVAAGYTLGLSISVLYLPVAALGGIGATALWYGVIRTLLNRAVNRAC
ncbi:hypothetical protein [Natrialba sp. SSL1]|uniref:hypothetical protein n=1 Tax=Natrialba sp. SSL1 TaxID=1869245 RepID=UPI0008F87388|nr:hypothetical protein [Natrialba sp. SSL1]OIB57617.1 hypothetical protein BBD46_12540 [Natrialba sp. SSL1]